MYILKKAYKKKKKTIVLLGVTTNQLITRNNFPTGTKIE